MSVAGQLSLRRFVALVAALLLAAAVFAAAGVATAPGAGAAPAYAPAATAPIHPGVMMYTEGAQCTANFIYTNGSDTYIGYAAHCAGTGGSTDTNGCTSPSLPLGTPVTIGGASRPGVLAYSSWLSMQAQHETDPNTCQYNDLALVKIDPADVAKVNPSVPHWGGPTGLNTTGIPTGQKVYSYGNSELRLGITLLSPKLGLSLGDQGAGWSHQTVTVTPGIPGDSGSALLDQSGRAAGVLSTLGILPLPGSNNFGDLNHELAWMHTHVPAFATTQLVPGDVPFNPNQLPLG